MLEDHQEGDNSTVVEVEVKIIKQTISFLIDPGLTHSYITPRLVVIFPLKNSKHRRSWLVQLATGTKKKISEVIIKCPLVMDGLVTYAYLNVLPLGSYDVLIGMDWLEAHREKLDCYNKNFECLDEKGNLMVVKGIPKVISRRKSSTMQLKKFYGKGCRGHAAHVLEIAENCTPILEGFHMLREFRNVFLMKFLGFLKRGTLI